MSLSSFLQRVFGPPSPPPAKDKLEAIIDKAAAERDRTARLVTALQCDPKLMRCPREISWEDLMGPENVNGD